MGSDALGLSEGDYFLPISALKHLEHCERRCALVHVHGEWGENIYTAHGQALHSRVDSGVSATVRGTKTFRSVEVRSRKLGLYGTCDAVEVRAGMLVPVEYKRGARKKETATHIQLCAQVMSLEEMSGQSIAEAFVFHAKIKRREAVAIDAGLRALTIHAADRLHTMLTLKLLPTAIYSARKCDDCSLLDICLPRQHRATISANQLLRELAGDDAVLQYTLRDDA